MAALAGKVLRTDVFSVELIGQRDRDRKCFVGGSLIIDIGTPRLPCDRTVVVFLVGAITIDIYDVLKVGLVDERSFSVFILELIIDCDIRRVSGCVRHDINGLILSGLTAVRRIRHGFRSRILCFFFHLRSGRGCLTVCLVGSSLPASEQGKAHGDRKQYT